MTLPELSWYWLEDNSCTFAALGCYELSCYITPRPYREVFQRRGPYRAQVAVIAFGESVHKLWESRKTFAKVAEARAAAVVWLAKYRARRGEK